MGRLIRMNIGPMRALPFIFAGALLVVAAARQANLPSPLAGHYQKLADAKGITLTFTSQVIGEAPADYHLELSKPAEYKLSYPSGFVTSDGKTVTTYNKDKNEYSQEPATADTLKAFLARPEVLGWAPLLAKNPTDSVLVAKLGSPRNVKGSPTTQVDVAMKDKGGNGTLYIDDKLGVVRGYDWKLGEKEYLVTATDIAVSPDALPDADFVFVAPDGAKLVEQQKSGSLFAGVSDLLSASCMPCHSAQSQRAGLDVTSYDSIVATVTPGDPANSLLVKALRGNGARKMPQGRPSLSEDQIQLVEKWIAAGAKKD